MTESTARHRIAMVLFPGLTQLDLTGPYEIFARMPGAEIVLVAAHRRPVASDRGLVLTPTATFEEAREPDILFVPGGPGQLEAMEDAALIGYLRDAGAVAGLVTAVCTGSLLLGAAGLLVGRRATTHWQVLDQLALLGAVPVEARVVEDDRVITGAGVSAGIDFALRVAARLCGARAAREIQLQIEYDPDPPFADGSPRSAEPELVAALRTRAADLVHRRREVARRIGQGLKRTR